MKAEILMFLAGVGFGYIVKTLIEVIRNLLKQKRNENTTTISSPGANRLQ